MRFQSSGMWKKSWKSIKYYCKFYAEAIFSGSFVATLVGVPVLMCRGVLASALHIVISLGIAGSIDCQTSNSNERSSGSAVSVLALLIDFRYLFHMFIVRLHKTYTEFTFALQFPYFYDML